MTLHVGKLSVRALEMSITNDVCVADRMSNCMYIHTYIHMNLVPIINDPLTLSRH